MPSEKPKKPFSLGEDRASFAMSDLTRAREDKLTFTPAKDKLNEPTIRDKDNAQPRPKPPFHLDHPRLAPPGMSGIKPSPPGQRIEAERSPKDRASPTQSFAPIAASRPHDRER